jgi:hypothetical protein
MSDPAHPPEPILGVIPPEGTYLIRLKLRMNRKGNTPSIVCDEITQDGLQGAIDRSSGLRLYLERVENLGPRPWILRGTMAFCGVDGDAITAPVHVDFLYYGPKPEAPDLAAADLAALDPAALATLLVRAPTLLAEALQWATLLVRAMTALKAELRRGKRNRP